MKKGKRSSIKKNNLERMEEVKRMLEELEYVTVELIKYSRNEKKPINREDIKELAQEYTEMPIEDMEVSLIWAKLNDFQKRLDEYRGEQKEKGDNPA